MYEQLRHISSNNAVTPCLDVKRPSAAVPTVAAGEGARTVGTAAVLPFADDRGGTRRVEPLSEDDSETAVGTDAPHSDDGTEAVDRAAGCSRARLRTDRRPDSPLPSATSLILDRLLDDARDELVEDDRCVLTLLSGCRLGIEVREDGGKDESRCSDSSIAPLSSLSAGPASITAATASSSFICATSSASGTFVSSFSSSLSLSLSLSRPFAAGATFAVSACVSLSTLSVFALISRIFAFSALTSRMHAAQPFFLYRLRIRSLVFQQLVNQVELLLLPLQPLSSSPITTLQLHQPGTNRVEQRK